jgi:hypothetical protein
MRKVLVGSAALCVLGFGLACSGMEVPGMEGDGGGGGGGGGDYDNVGACKRYVEAYNNAACIPVDLNATDNCPDSLNQTPCDLAKYYDCMASAVKCNGDMPDLTGFSACGSPTCN